MVAKISYRTKKTAAPITKDMNLGQLAKTYPAVAQFLREEYGLHCIGCFANTFDNLEAGLRVHGYTEEDIEGVLKEVNSLIPH